MPRARPVKDDKAPTKAQLAFVEEAALAFEQQGLPRMGGRILGWMLVCEPAHQSLQEIGERVQASQGSVSTMTRLLVGSGVLKRFTKAGDRRDYLVVPDDFAATGFAQLVERMRAMRQLAERGLLALEGEPAPRRERLRGMRELYAFFEQDAEDLVARWEAHRRKGARAAGRSRGS